MRAAIAFVTFTAIAIPLFGQAPGKRPLPSKSDVPKLIESLLKDRDVQVRRSAAADLGKIGRNARTAVPALVSVVSNNKEHASVRSEAAVALRYIGNCRAAKDAIPAITGVLLNKKNPIKVREYCLYALRVHGEDLRNEKRLMKAMETIVSKEPKLKSNKILRYDCGYMLGMLLEEDVSDAAMKTLEEIMYDGELWLEVAPEIAERKPTKPQKVSRADGRVMAVHALSYTGAEKIKAYPRILRKMRELAAGPTTDPQLKKMTKRVLAQLELE